MWPGRRRSPGRVRGSTSAWIVAARSAGGDAGGRAVAVVDGDEEGGALALGVLLDHRVEVELAGPLGGERGADDARGVPEEERDRLGRGELGRHDEVALVLAVLVVDDDDDLAPPDGGDRFFDLGEGHQPLPILPG